MGWVDTLDALDTAFGTTDATWQNVRHATLDALEAAAFVVEPRPTVPRTIAHVEAHLATAVADVGAFVLAAQALERALSAALADVKEARHGAA